MNKRWYLACVGVILVGLLFRQPLLLIVALLSMLVLLTADIWAKFCLNDLRFERKLSEHRVLFGEEITLSFAVENAKLLPLPWLEISDTVPRTLNIQGRQMRINPSTNRAVLENLFSPRWYERVTRRYTLLCNTRGVHTFGPTSIRSGDLFGFTERQETLDNRQYLIVYPLILPLSSFSLPSSSPFGDQRTRRRLLEDPSRVIGVRDYTYGDDLRRVHWKATARTMQLQSKIYEPTTTYTLVMFLNVATQLDSYFGIHPELQELSICAAASVADWALNEGYAVGLHSNSFMYMPEVGVQPAEKLTQNAGHQASVREVNVSEQLNSRRIQIMPASNEEQRKRIMETLARIQTFFGNSIEEMIQNERNHLPAGATVVVITSTISEPLLEILNRLKLAGHAVTILLAGNQAVASRLAGIPVYHIGGEETWKSLNSCYNLLEGEGANASERQMKEIQNAAFSL